MTSDRVDFARLEALPEPVARYLRRALRDGQPPIRSVRLRQEGLLRTDARSRWMTFTATHVVTLPATEFVWDARVEIFPWVHLRVRDAYVGGEGSGRVSLMSVLPLAMQGSRLEVSSGSLHRYLAEAVWYPTALLPGPALQWSPISGTKALAVLTHAGLTVALEFWFNESGEVSGIYTPARWGAFDGTFKQVAWEGRLRGYGARDGLFVPSEAEVGWYTGDTWDAVWKGRISDVRCELAGDAGGDQRPQL